MAAISGCLVLLKRFPSARPRKACVPSSASWMTAGQADTEVDQLSTPDRRSVPDSSLRPSKPPWALPNLCLCRGPTPLAGPASTMPPDLDGTARLSRVRGLSERCWSFTGPWTAYPQLRSCHARRTIHSRALPGQWEHPLNVPASATPPDGTRYPAFDHGARNIGTWQTTSPVGKHLPSGRSCTTGSQGPRAKPCQRETQGGPSWRRPPQQTRPPRVTLLPRPGSQTPIQFGCPTQLADALLASRAPRLPPANLLAPKAMANNSP